MTPLTIATDLLAAAIALSGLPPIAATDLPPLYAVSKAELAQTVCPDNPAQCKAMAAIFDTEKYRILILSTLDLKDPEDNSFLLHELVHVLQFKQSGDAGFNSCQAIVNSERDAYRAQNTYLADKGLFSQQGMMMRYMQCPPEGSANAGLPVVDPRAVVAPR